VAKQCGRAWPGHPPDGRPGALFNGEDIDQWGEFGRHSDWPGQQFGRTPAGGTSVTQSAVVLLACSPTVCADVIHFHAGTWTADAHACWRTADQDFDVAASGAWCRIGDDPLVASSTHGSDRPDGFRRSELCTLRALVFGFYAAAITAVLSISAAPDRDD
jgi:hypothetical protein